MYVIEYLKVGAHTSQTLWEMTAKELREAKAKELRENAGIEGGATRSYERVSGKEAHDYVRRDGVHNTGLWINSEGRIRYAKEND